MDRAAHRDQAVLVEDDRIVGEMEWAGLNAASALPMIAAAALLAG